MSTFRTFTPRILRLELSTRYRCLRRRPQSTLNHTNTSAAAAPPPPNFFRRNRAAIIWSTLALTGGIIAGQFVVHTIAPPPLPSKDTREDAILIADLNQRIDNEFKVKVLRGKCLGVAKQLKGEDGGWVEVVPLPIEFSEKKNTTTQDDGLIASLQGAKGLGVERLFWDRGNHELRAVIWFGGSLAGWPGVTHGGAIATEIAEKLSLAAALASNGNSNNDVLAAATPQRLPGTGDHAKMLAPANVPDEPAQLSIGYVKPTYANNFYVIRVVPAMPISGDERKDLVKFEPHGGADYEATLETLEGKTCVKARARFAPSTAVQRATGDVVGGAKSSYESFKEWMWPSRQKQSQSSATTTA